METLQLSLRPAIVSRQGVWLGLAYLCAYVFLHWITFFSEYSDIGVTPWNPETGIAVALAWHIGAAAAPLTLIASFVGALMTDSSIDYGLLLLRAVIYAAVYTAAGLALRYRKAADGASARFVIMTLAVAGIAAALFALLWLSTLTAVGVLAVKRFYAATFTAAIGDMIGIVTILPAFVETIVSANLAQRIKKHLSELLLAGLGIALIAYVVFGLDSTDQFKVFYLVFIPVVVLAMRLGFAGAAFGIVLSDVAMMVTIYLREVSVATATELQVLMISLSATGLLLGSVVSERSRLAADLTTSTARLHEAQSALEHASRVLLVNELAAAIAHELNQPLSAARNFVRAIERLLMQPRIDRKRLAELSAAAVREVDGAGAIIQETRQFLRKDIYALAKADGREAIGISLRMLHSELRKAGVRVAVDIADDLPAIRIDAVKLQQILLNLLRNAIDALSEQPDRERRIGIAARRAAKGFVEIGVTDSGGGIAQTVRARLFQPFTTSKSQGLGLGLSLSRSIVEDYGGELELDARSAATRFVLSLPAVRERPA
jgi:C4-dicarboxylate-specific signal transduction histidine kinase